MSGQFYAIYGNTYQHMSTKPMLEQAWGTGELIDQLAAMRQTFGYAELSGPMPLFNQSPPAAPTTSTNKMASSPRNQHLRLSSTNHHLSTLVDQPHI